MQFRTTHLLVSLTVALSEHLRANGYDVYWQATGDTDAQTVLEEARGTVTLVPEFPANPAPIVRLKSDGMSAETIVVPALTLRVLGSPDRQEILGLGHRDYLWHRHVRVDGFAADEFQQRELADLLHEWLNSEERKEFPVYDYTTDPANAALVGQAWVEIAATDYEELFHEVEAVRYYVSATSIFGYVE